MSIGLALERLITFSRFLADKPDFSSILEYLSKNVSPSGEFCGVTVGVLNDEEFIDTTVRIGFKVPIEKKPIIHLDSDHPLATSLRTQTMLFIDLVDTLGKFKDLPQEYSKVPYRSICSIPLNQSLIIFLAFEKPIEETSKYSKYFECIRASLIMYLALQNRKFANEFAISGLLSPRQKIIREMILLGKSNREIAEELSYSVSLIRQESMRIYAKLGISGRNELRFGNSNQVNRAQKPKDKPTKIKSPSKTR